MVFTREDILPAAELCGLSEDETTELFENVQKSGAVSLDYLIEYAEFMTAHHGELYQPNIDSCEILGGKLWYIEPFCGSTTYVLETEKGLVVIDTGFPCYADDLRATLKSLFPNYDTIPKEMIMTHMDMDHAGLLDFDTIWMSKTSYDDFLGRAAGKPNLRETHPVRAPIYRISSLLSADRGADPSCMRPINTFEPNPNEPLTYIGTLNLDPFSFAVYETSGGHVAGSIVLIEEANRLVFTGDALVNPEMSDGQKNFIRVGTEMLGSLNADSAKAKTERAAVFGLMGSEPWIVCPGHGFPIFPAANK